MGLFIRAPALLSVLFSRHQCHYLVAKVAEFIIEASRKVLVDRYDTMLLRLRYGATVDVVGVGRGHLAELVEDDLCKRVQCFFRP